MTTDTEKRLAEIRERAEKAVASLKHQGWPTDCAQYTWVSSDIPFLLAEIERRDREIAGMNEDIKEARSYLQDAMLALDEPADFVDFGDEDRRPAPTQDEC